MVNIIFMNKNRLIAFSVLCLFSSKLYAQIPNGGFEDFVTTPFNIQSWKAYTSGTGVIQRVEPGHLNSKYAVLIGGNTATIFSYCQGYNYCVMPLSRPYGLGGYWKTDNFGGGNCTFSISKKGGGQIGSGTGYLGKTNNEWYRFIIPINYTVPNVDGLIFSINFSPAPNGSLVLDDLEWIMEKPVGIENINNTNIKIYPNPTNNIINIQGLNKNEIKNVQLFDVQGKLVIVQTITENGTIDLSELNKGIYVIKIGEFAQRIVKF
jgi:hypothetical protein